MEDESFFKKPCPKSLWQCFALLLRGIFMGAADIVPGISGGTIAFITGIYEDLLLSIKSFDVRAAKLLFSLQWRRFFSSVAWEFLFILGLGIAIAIFFLSTLFVWLLNQEVYYSYLYSVFLGLILGSVAFCIKQVEKWTKQTILAFFLGFIIAFFLSTVSSQLWSDEAIFHVYLPKEQVVAGIGSKMVSNYDWEAERLLGVSGTSLLTALVKGKLSEDALVYNVVTKQEGKVKDFIDADSISYFSPFLFFCGMIAVCAMLLPGISGSYLLNVFGAYGVVIGAVSEFSMGLGKGILDGGAFSILYSLFLGVVCGAALFSRFITWLFRSYRQVAISLLIGFMLGAIRSVWPFWAYEFNLSITKLSERPNLHLLYPIFPDIENSAFWLSIGLATITFFFVIAVEAIASRRKSVAK